MSAFLTLILLFPTSPHVTPPAPTVTAAHVSAPAVRWTPGMPKTFRPAPPRPSHPHRPWRWR